jgi:carboxyl-terminal processing protease
MKSRFIRKPTVIWAVVTVFFCLVLTAATMPADGANTDDEQRATRRYTAVIDSVFQFVKDHYVEKVDDEKLYEGAMTGMLNSLGDPYSVFLPATEMTDLNQNVIKGTYGGVGLYISKPQAISANGTPPYVEVASPIEDTPGWKAGIKPGDLILKIEDKSTGDMSMDQVLSYLKGPAGEAVHITVQRGRITFPVTLIREVIEVPTVKHAMIGDIGYVRLITFSTMTAERTREAIASFQKAGYKSLILDLRYNYGGLLSAAVQVCNMFVQGGVVVSVKSRIAEENASYAGANKEPLVPADIPVVVLINHGSASASEIVAGCLKDRKRAYIIGERSYGKGSVQQVFPLGKVGFKLTTARYYTPSDVNIDKKGIPPDDEVLFPKYTDAQVESLTKLLQDGRIKDFVSNTPDASQNTSNQFAQKLANDYNLDYNLTRRLLHEEQVRTQTPPVYDLEYDVQLDAAVKILKEGNWRRLVNETKTLSELQAVVPATDAQS